MSRKQKVATFFVIYYELVALPFELYDVFPVWIGQLGVVAATWLTMISVTSPSYSGKVKK